MHRAGVVEKPIPGAIPHRLSQGLKLVTQRVCRRTPDDYCGSLRGHLDGHWPMDAYRGLFAAAFIAATRLPFYSELALAGLIAAGYEPWPL